MMTLKTRDLLFGCAAVLAAGSVSAAVIVDDDVEGNGDAVVTVGSVTSAWAGWDSFVAQPPGYSSLIDAATDEDAGVAGVGDPLEALNNGIPVGGSIAAQTVTYGGAVAAGTYTVQIQIVDFGNRVFTNPTVTFAGLTETSSSTPIPTVPTPDAGLTGADGDDEIWTLTYEVAEGDAEIGNDLVLTLNVPPYTVPDPLPFTGNNGNYFANTNYGVDHVRIDFVPIPEPGSLALLGLSGLMIARRRRG